ncbi:MAG: hypothetical protein WKF79_04135 [Nocardioides sp.]
MGPFGLPWSWPAIDGTGDLDGATQLLAIFGAAVLNLALHALVGRWLHRRSRTR